MPNSSVEVKLVLRIAFDAGKPYTGKNKAGKEYSVLSCLGSGSLVLAPGVSMPVNSISFSRFLQDGRQADAVYSTMLGLRRGDRVEVACLLEERPYQVKDKDRWSLQPGEVYSVRVLERAAPAPVEDDLVAA